jgi:fatty acid-binding protein DegV
MAAYLTGWGDDLRVAIGLADRHAEALTMALREHVALSPRVTETISYRIGPAIGSHTGPGSVGALAFPGRFPVTAPG